MRIVSVTGICVGILQYGTGSTIAIVGFAIWPDLTSMQLLNHAIKTRPTVYYNESKKF